MSLIDTDGRSGRFRTRAQNCAITIESAPRSSKKLLSTDTRSTLHDVSQHLGEGCSRCSTPGRPVGAVRPVSGQVGAQLHYSGSLNRQANPGRPAVTARELPAPWSWLRRTAKRWSAPSELSTSSPYRSMHPVGLVDGVEIALAEVRGDGHRGEVVRVVLGSTSSIAPLTTVPVEPPNRNPVRASRWQARMVSASSTHDDLVDVGLIEHRRADTRAEPGDHPASRRATKGHRAHAVHCHDPDRPVPLAEVAGAAHQGPAGPGADEQHVELRELAGDRRSRAAVVRLPVLRIGVLIQPHVAVVGRTQRTDIVDPRAEEAADADPAR